MKKLIQKKSASVYLTLLISLLTLNSQAQDRFHKMFKFERPENSTSWKSNLIGIDFLDTSHYLISVALNGTMYLEDNALTDEINSPNGTSYIFELKDGKILKSYHCDPRMKSVLDVATKKGDMIYFSGTFQKGSILDTTPGQTFNLWKGKESIFSKKLYHFGPCSGIEEYCGGEAFYVGVKDNEVKAFCSISSLGSKFQFATDANNNIWASPEDVSYFQDSSIYINDSLHTLESPRFMIQFDPQGNFKKIVHESISTDHVHAQNTKMIMGNDKIYTYHSFYDSLKLDGKLIKIPGLNYVIMAYNLDGKLLWEKIWGTGESQAMPFTVDKNDNLMLIGNTEKKDIKIGNEQVKTFKDFSYTTYIYKIDKTGKDVSTWFYPGIDFMLFGKVFYNQAKQDIYIAAFDTIGNYPWYDGNFPGKGSYLFKIDAKGGIYPNTVPLPVSIYVTPTFTSVIPASIVSMGFMDDRVQTLTNVSSYKWAVGEDSFDCTDINTSYFLLSSYPDWLFTNIQQEKVENTFHGEVYFSNNTLHILGKAEKIEIYDLNGKIIYHAVLKHNSNNSQIQMNLIPGLYIYKILQNNKVCTGKFVTH